MTHLRKKDDNIKVYSFDINIVNPVLNTLKESYEITGPAPIMIINDEVYQGFKDKEGLEELIFS